MSPFRPSLHLILGSLPEDPHKVIPETQKTYCTAEMEEIKEKGVAAFKICSIPTELTQL